MKVRNSFVSNSSSSSFIIKNPENFEKVKKIVDEIYRGDYYELDGYLFTSMISDGVDLYNELYDLCDERADGGSNGPYDIDNYFEFEGDKGIDSVFIEKRFCKDKLKVEQYMKDKLYNFVNSYRSIYECSGNMDIDIQEYFINNCFCLIDIDVNEDEDED